MTPAALLARMSGLGISLAARGESLRVSAPAGSVTPEIRRELAEAKAALLPLLREPPHPVSDPVGHGRWWCERYRAAGAEPTAAMLAMASGRPRPDRPLLDAWGCAQPQATTPAR